MEIDSADLATLSPTTSNLDPPPTKQRSDSQGSQKSLSGEDLIIQVSRMVKDRARAELIALELMEEYNFDFHEFKRLLKDNNLEVSFSRVRYQDIAPKVGLQPYSDGLDIPTFPIFQARLSNDLFRKILEDIQLFTYQYRPLPLHDTEEARSRFLSAYFNRIVGLFSGLIYNTPESMLEGKIASKGRIEYQFKTFGGVTVLFIEVKLSIGSLRERLDCIAQVIAEADACAWMNFQQGFRVPIIAVLCDGRSFTFFKFLDRRQTRTASPQFFIGQFPNGSLEQVIVGMAPGVDPTNFFHHSRSICESLFYVFLTGYHCGLKAHWDRSMEASKKQGHGRQSTPMWQKAVHLASDAIDSAKLACTQWEEGQVEESKKSAESVLEYLACSVDEVPRVQPSFDLLELFRQEFADMNA
ncbi:MAG: hypothetical protein M1839_002459 [Geoglossum umbratile]|nr:MAG: hypothetical protein M1839_002459 [Geoglossum umbratile]